jgi:hypothetical protein
VGFDAGIVAQGIVQTAISVRNSVRERELRAI